MEEYYDRHNFSGAQGFLKIHNAPLSMVCGGHLVNPVEEASASVDMIKGDDTINWECVCRDFAVKVLRQLTVECSVGAAEEIVRQLEIGDEYPCIEWNNPLENENRLDGTSFGSV